MITSRPALFDDHLMTIGHACLAVTNVFHISGCSIVETACTLGGVDELKLDNTLLREGVRLLKLSGPFTIKDIWDFQAVARSVTEPITIIDVTDVPYMDSASLGTLMGVHVSREKAHSKYAIVGLNERIETLLQVAGVEKILVRYTNVEDALKALGIKE
jgi:anti-anti-sigma factor